MKEKERRRTAADYVEVAAVDRDHPLYGIFRARIEKQLELAYARGFRAGRDVSKYWASK